MKVGFILIFVLAAAELDNFHDGFLALVGLVFDAFLGEGDPVVLAELLEGGWPIVSWGMRGLKETHGLFFNFEVFVG